MNKEKIFWLPAILSAIVPGLGQLLKGHFLKALLMWTFVTICWYLFGWTIILWLLYAFAWLINVVDAGVSTWSGA